MKVEPIYFRETTVEHYGKRGILWHGCMAHYFTFDTEEGEIPAANDQRMYFDHIF